ncbi:MAG: autotransporter-associated beta strand repeat-containing protein [Pirellulales bacterium]
MASAETRPTGANSYAGDTIISNGILQVGDGGGTGSLGSGAVINNAALIVNRTGTVTIPGGISGSGSLTKQGPGTLTLSGANTYSGGTVVSAGTLVRTESGTLDLAGTATFAGGATFAYEVDSTDLDALGVAADLLVVTGDLNLSTDPTSRTLLSFTDIAGTAQPFIEDTTIFAFRDRHRRPRALNARALRRGRAWPHRGRCPPPPASLTPRSRRLGGAAGMHPGRK